VEGEGLADRLGPRVQLRQPPLVLGVVGWPVGEDQHVLALRIAAQTPGALGEDAAHLGRVEEALLAEREARPGVEDEEGHPVVAAPTAVADAAAVTRLTVVIAVTALTAVGAPGPVASMAAMATVT